MNIDINTIKSAKDLEIVKILNAKSKIEKVFNENPTKIFRRKHISSILSENGKAWELAYGTSATNFINVLKEHSDLKESILESEHYTSEKRFIWGHPSIYAVALSLKPNSYLTHGTAIFLHGLNDQIPQTVYVNYEQSQKNYSLGSLTQSGLDKAFSNNQRKSNLTYRYDGKQITFINGKYTNKLEVSPMLYNGENLNVTRLERTLIDITVRPAYSGGVFQILEAFKNAKDRISVNTLIATLKKLNYLYPYHQAIGFYMERAGFPENQCAKLLNLGLDFDFYLAHKLPNDKEYDAKWRLYYPKGF